MEEERLNVQLLLDPEEPAGKVMVAEKARLIQIWSERVQLPSHMTPFKTFMQSADNMEQRAKTRENGNTRTIVD